MKKSILIFLFFILFISGCSSKKEIIEKKEVVEKIDIEKKEPSNRMEAVSFYEIDGFFEDDLDYAIKKCMKCLKYKRA